MKEEITPISKASKARDVNEVGKIVYDIFDEGLRFIIMRGPYHWCGYIGIPIDHPLAGFSYEDILFISAHGGLTFADKGKNEWPVNYYWYGWDYGHLGDYSHFNEKNFVFKLEQDEKDWTLQEVIEDSQDTIYEFKKLMKLAEKIKR